MIGALTLKQAGSEDMLLEPESGLMVTSIDYGFPSIRSSVQNNQGRSGTQDHTKYHGARVVTMSATLLGKRLPERREVVQRLSDFAVPGNSPVLVEELEGHPARALDMRVENWASPLVGGQFDQVQISWVVPSGTIRSAEPRLVSTPVQRGGAASGRSYDWSPDRSYPHADPPGVALVNSIGKIPAPWVIRIYGYCINPDISIDGGDSLVKFGVGPVPHGNYWECDSEMKTVYENSSVSSDRRNSLDYLASKWTPLAPGETSLMFTAGDPSVPCRAEIEWYDRWLI